MMRKQTTLIEFFFPLDNKVHRLTEPDISERETPRTEGIFEESDADGDEFTDDVRHVGQRSLSLLDLLSEVTERLDNMQKEIAELKEGKKIGSCTEGWYKFGKSCYYFSRYKINWFDSMVFCMASGGYLAEINDASENSYLWHRLKHLKDYQFWIGGTDLLQENDFIWMHSQTRITTAVFRNWLSFEPNNQNGVEHCMTIIRDEGFWNDNNCYSSHEFICEKDLK